MFKQTFWVIRTNLALYAVFCICWVGLEFLGESSGKNASGVVGITLLAALGLNVQNSVLSNLNFTAAAKQNKLHFGRYMLKTGVLFLLGIAIMVGSLILIFPRNGKSSPYFTLSLISSFIVSFTIVLSLLGTWLPATIHGVNKSLADAFRRGWPRFFSTGAHVLAGICIPIIISLGASMAVSMVSGLNLLESGGLSAPAIVFSSASSVLQAVGWTYVSVALARRYMEAENIGSPSQELLTVFT
ncbi:MULTISPECIES: hypothetical protein [Rhizobium]|uniref:Uncharacterized protein n=1 Tax=Rhizobium tropici TaxID=398 RepID=A0A6P1CF46_RHITR|nr:MULTISPECIES: hypothetical protein [Rhizobium]AGB70240.1 hypothetical protein RTCIAT899_CH04135 [Rhizobium tropici CIAT 899]MBB4239362.1 hypothetical protein [Rhizobium tropici]MBB5590632.1 hypothetical protein [Rhizobium tropici]MBB6490159.1 hypothetical protein [Rhizobium tropici]NEV14976.1 hypothetical protein [Rhizobium tropici]